MPDMNIAFQLQITPALPGEFSTRNQLAVHCYESSPAHTGCTEAAKEDSAQDEEVGKTGGGTWSAIL